MKSRYFSKPTQKQFIEIQKSIKEIQRGEIFNLDSCIGEFIISVRIVREY